jgi:hypothetical protein
VFSRFSRKKVKADALLNVEKSIAVELRTFTNHLQTFTLAYDALGKQYGEIIKLLEENKKNVEPTGS